MGYGGYIFHIYIYIHIQKGLGRGYFKTARRVLKVKSPSRFGTLLVLRKCF